MKKHLKKMRLLLLFAVLFMLTNCQEEFQDTPTTQQSNKGEHTILTGAEALEMKAKLITYLEKSGGIGLSRLSSKLIDVSTDPNAATLNDVKQYIDDSEVYRVKMAPGKENYTYKINIPNASSKKFYNLVVKQRGALKKTILVAYNLNSKFESEYAVHKDFSKFSGYIAYEVIASDNGFPCNEEPGPVPVSGGTAPGPGGGGPGGAGPGKPNPGVGTGIGGPYNPGNPYSPYNQLLVDAKFQALKISAGVNSPEDEPWHWVSRSPRDVTWKTIPGISGSNNPCDDEDEIGILDPANDPHKKNCEELTLKSMEPSFDAKMSELTTKAGTQNFESAYTLYQNASQGLLFSGEAQGSSNAPEVSLNLSQSTTQSKLNCIGFMHCHLDNGTTFGIFSFSDLIALATLASISTRPTNELVVYVTSAQGTFALKVNDKIKLKNYLQMMEIAANSYEAKFYDFVKKTDPLEKQTLGFLNFIKDQFPDTGLGTELYQQNVDGEWERLKLSSNGKKIERKKC